MQQRPNKDRDTNKIVISDWGGVVSHQDNYALRYISLLMKEAQASIGEEHVEDVLIKEMEITKRYKLYSTEDTSIVNQAAQELIDYMQSPLSAKDFLRLRSFVNMQYGSYDDIGDYIRSLRDRCKIGILSNLTVCDKLCINSHMRFQFFDYIWLSCEMDCEKPEVDIYNKVMNDCGLEPNSILFIDDNANNIEMANKVGWNTHHVKEEGNLSLVRESIESFLNDK